MRGVSRVVPPDGAQRRQGNIPLLVTCARVEARRLFVPTLEHAKRWAWRETRAQQGGAGRYTICPPARVQAGRHCGRLSERRVVCGGRALRRHPRRQPQHRAAPPRPLSELRARQRPEPRAKGAARFCVCSAAAGAASGGGGGGGGDGFGGEAVEKGVAWRGGETEGRGASEAKGHGQWSHVNEDACWAQTIYRQ